MQDEQSVDQFFEIVNRRELSKLGKLLSESAEFYFPKTQPLLGREKIIQFFRILFRQYPELVFEIKRKIIQKGWMAAHWVNQGVNRNGDQYNNEGVTLLEMQDGKITFISDFFKDTEKF
jgi:ketosteroid isomerase-like protein